MKASALPSADTALSIGLMTSFWTTAHRVWLRDYIDLPRRLLAGVGRPFKNLTGVHFQHRDNPTGHWLPRCKLDTRQSVAQECLSLALV
jgi:hypothetical protein